MCGQSWRHWCGSCGPALIRDDETGNDVRVLTGQIAITHAIEFQIKRMKDRVAGLAGSKPSNKLVVRACAFVAQDTVLHFVRIYNIKILPGHTNAAKFIEEQAVSAGQNGGRKQFSILVVSMDVILVRVVLGVS